MEGFGTAATTTHDTIHGWFAADLEYPTRDNESGIVNFIGTIIHFIIKYQLSSCGLQLARDDEFTYYITHKLFMTKFYTLLKENSPRDHIVPY